MIILWLVTGASLLVSVAALVRVRQLAKRLEDVSQLYWGLRYQHGELRAQIQAGDGFIKPADPAAAPPSRAPAEAFVPLSSVKR